MNDITALMATMKAVAEKATQGKWWIDSHGEAVVAFQDGENVLPIFKTDRVGMGPAIRHEDTGNLSHWRNDNDATFIATACPANVLALVAALEKAQQKADIYDMLREDYGLCEKGVGLADFVDWQAKRIASLESRTVTVKLPDFTLYQCDDCGAMWVDEHETKCHCCGDKGTWTAIPVVRSAALAGIQVIEGEGR